MWLREGPLQLSSRSLRSCISVHFHAVSWHHNQIRSRTSKKKRISEGKVKIPHGSIFLLCLLYSGEFFFFFFSTAFPAHLYFLEKSTQHGPDVLLGSAAKSPSAACILVPLMGWKGRGSEGGEGRLPAACIMPELFHATGSPNFRIHPRSFAFCGPFTAG